MITCRKIQIGVVIIAVILAILFVPFPARKNISTTGIKTDAYGNAEYEVTLRFSGIYWQSLTGYVKLTGKINLIDNTTSDYRAYSLAGHTYKQESSLWTSIRRFSSELNGWEHGSVCFDYDFTAIGIDTNSITVITRVPAVS
jgi:hypothetical protein